MPTKKKTVHKSTSSQEVSEDTKLIIVVLLLIFAYPIGVILMWFWMKWPKWVKILITIPLLIIPVVVVLGILAAIILVAVNPKAQLEKAKKMQQQYEYKQDMRVNPTSATDSELTY